MKKNKFNSNIVEDITKGIYIGGNVMNLRYGMTGTYSRTEDGTRFLFEADGSSETVYDVEPYDVYIGSNKTAECLV